MANSFVFFAKHVEKLDPISSLDPLKYVLNANHSAERNGHRKKRGGHLSVTHATPDIRKEASMRTGMQGMSTMFRLSLYLFIPLGRTFCSVAPNKESLSSPLHTCSTSADVTTKA